MFKAFKFENAKPAHTHGYLWPEILRLCPGGGRALRVLDVGCGNGAMAAEFIVRGCDVVGIDLSEQGIEIARRTYPAARFEVLTADDGIMDQLGCDPFDVVISTEVVEHLYDPRSYVRGCFAATKAGGRFICSTPYHGYLKHLALSVLGKWDSHADPVWDGGHIKLWSYTKLRELLAHVGFKGFQFAGTGRMPYLWKSMVVSAERA